MAKEVPIGPTEFKVREYLKEVSGSARGIAAALGLSYDSAQKGLRRLFENKLISREKIGRDWIYSLWTPWKGNAKLKAKSKKRNGKKTRMTEALVKKILRMEGKPQAEIAKKMGVQQPFISDIFSGRRWSRVTGRRYHPSHRA